MNFKTRRILFIAMIAAICLPISLLWTTIIVVTAAETLILDYNEFCYQKYETKKD